MLQWCVNFHGRRGLSIHQFSLPGYPASHACVRLLEPDAVWFYDWVEEWILAPDGLTALARGTPILIFGEPFWRRVIDWAALVEAGTIAPHDPELFTYVASPAHAVALIDSGSTL